MFTFESTLKLLGFDHRCGDNGTCDTSTKRFEIFTCAIKEKTSRMGGNGYIFCSADAVEPLSSVEERRSPCTSEK